MSKPHSMYDAIVAALDKLSAPPGADIAARIVGLHQMLTGEARAADDSAFTALSALKEARGLLSQHAPGDTLADMARSLVERHAEALRQRDEQVLLRGRAQQAEADALERAGRFEVRAEIAEQALRLDETARVEVMAELAQLRAEVARLSAQLDYASEQIQAGLRRGA